MLRVDEVAEASSIRNALPVRFSIGASRNPVRTHSHGTGLERDRIGMGGAGRDTLFHRANPGEFEPRLSRSGHASWGRDAVKKVRSGHIPSQPNGPDRGHFHHKGTRAQRNPTCWVMLCFVCDLRSDQLKLGTGHQSCDTPWHSPGVAGVEPSSVRRQSWRVRLRRGEKPGGELRSTPSHPPGACPWVLRGDADTLRGDCGGPGMTGANSLFVYGECRDGVRL